MKLNRAIDHVSGQRHEWGREIRLHRHFFRNAAEAIESEIIVRQIPRAISDEECQELAESIGSSVGHRMHGRLPTVGIPVDLLIAIVVQIAWYLIREWLSE